MTHGGLQLQRKLEDAIQSLDVAVAPASSSVIERPTPSKRPHLTRSLYSTLTKYGIKSKEDPKLSPDTTDKVDVSRRAPRLAAILSRSATRSKESPFKHLSAPPAHAASEYRPSSTQSFLARLASYKITTYANKPPQIDAVAAARCGWINEGKDRLICGICDVSWVVAGREGMTKEAANTLVEKQRVSLVDMHKDGCPWKTRQCDASIYRVPLQSPAAMVRDLRTTACSLEPLVANVAINHPLTASQINSLHVALAARSSTSGDDSAMQVDTTNPSDTSIITTLFGWTPAPPPPTDERRRTSSFSASRAGSYGPSASMPPTPSLSRSSSVSCFFRERESTPTPSASPRMSAFQSSASHPQSLSRLSGAWASSISRTRSATDTSLVHCTLCQRRVGLWAFPTSQTDTAPSVDADSLPRKQKQFDLVKEHRTYCPYVVCSTAVPSFPSPSTTDSSSDIMEGWRAVLTVIQRHGLGQRQRLSRFTQTGEGANQAHNAELEGVEAMVARVKSKGGKELLGYVKGLLG
ncbi:C3HC zinc finger-like-domain-containing protein [Phlebopus sp. FC_14]|nr:C3HC zinc finger-like-domain-containing protein [Phlebopus sp. FC_14]